MIRQDAYARSLNRILGAENSPSDLEKNSEEQKREKKKKKH